jgi:hypothetical protein
MATAAATYAAQAPISLKFTGESLRGGPPSILRKQKRRRLGHASGTEGPGFCLGGIVAEMRAAQGACRAMVAVAVAILIACVVIAWAGGWRRVSHGTAWEPVRQRGRPR